MTLLLNYSISIPPYIEHRIILIVLLISLNVKRFINFCNFKELNIHCVSNVKKTNFNADTILKIEIGLK